MGKGIDKFMNILSLSGSDDDDYDNDDLFDDEIDLVEPKPARQPKQRKEKTAPAKQTTSGYNTAPKTQAAATYAEDDAYETGSSYSKKPRQTRPARSTSTSNKVVSMNGRGSEVYVIKPQEFNEAQTVTDFLKDGKTIVINMEGIELNAAQRIIDFIGGACYALDGTLQAISSNIFIAAPQDIEVSGDLRDEILNESTVSPYLGAY